jgi:hypothetical protein
MNFFTQNIQFIRAFLFLCLFINFISSQTFTTTTSSSSSSDILTTTTSLTTSMVETSSVTSGTITRTSTISGTTTITTPASDAFSIDPSYLLAIFASFFLSLALMKTIILGSAYFF